MKWLFFTTLLLIGFFGYRTHLEHVRAENDRVAAEAMERERVQRYAEQERERQQRSAELEKERLRRLEEQSVKDEAERKRREAEQEASEARMRRPALAITKIIDPLFVNVLAPIDMLKPWDLVPQLEITKQRVLDKQARAEAERKSVYDRAAEAFDGLIALADERTKIIEEMLTNKAKSGALDQPGRANSSADFFNRGVAKHWDDLVARYKPMIFQRIEALRSAERTWNSNVDEHALEEAYELPSLDPVVIVVEPGADPDNAFGATSSSNGKVSRGWRRTYYDVNGYRYPTVPNVFR